MAVILMDIRPVTALNEHGDMVKFKPVGPLIEVGDASEFYAENTRSNPILEDADAPSQGARIHIGFNVGTEQRWTMTDVIDIIFNVRRAQVAKAIKSGYAKPHPHGGDVGASFVARKGLWQPVHSKKAEPEDGAEIMIMNIIHEHKAKFRQDMINLAEVLADDLEQNSVLLEFQEYGVVKRILSIAGSD